jgi:amino acid/peptide transporter (Peptide:H+ symporter), bacterial/amino acid/peptide transporter (Peptide:H+ symporter), bacterial
MKNMAQASPDAGPSKQPPGLFLLFGVEMWERFSFYGMRAFLTLFLISTAGGFGWSKEQASHLYGWYQGLVYLTPLLGGYLADRFIGTHRSIIIGGIIIASGHFCLAVPAKPTFFLGLSLIILGTGFFKSNISTMVGQLYSEKDRRRDAAFTIFYMGINLGASMGQIVCPKLADAFNWHIGFSAAGFGMVLGLLVYLLYKRRFLGTIGDIPARRAAHQSEKISTSKQALTALEKQGITAIAVLAFFNIFFWMAFEQAGSSMTFFAEERTRRMFLGLNFLAPYFQSVNSISVILLAPVFAWMWTRLEARGRAPSTPVRFALGLFLLGSGFIVLVIGARLSDRGIRVSPLWLIATYVLHTCGELCLSPVGLSMVTKLAPARFASLAMGAWFFSMFISDLLAGLLAGTVEKIEKGQVFHLLGGQADFFLMFVVSTFVAGAVLLAISPSVKRLMAGRA